MKMIKIPLVNLQKQHKKIRSEINNAIKNVIDSSIFIGGTEKDNFEKKFAKFCGAKFCVGLSNGTDAIFLSLKALGIKKGDLVITQANTFIATSEAISMVGAKPLFVDCDENYLINCDQVEELLCKFPNKIKAIIPVHMYGQISNMVRLSVLAKKYSVYLIEDAAQAHGASIKNKKVGTWGEIGCFSFYPGKNLGALGDAGAITTNDENLALKIKMLSNHGRKEKYYHEFEGYNKRLDTLQAAVLNVKLNYLHQWNKQRITLAKRYIKKLSYLQDSGKIFLPAIYNGFKHVYHLFVVRVQNREKVISHLKKHNIQTGIHYPYILVDFSFYESSILSKKISQKNQFINSIKFQSEILSLPIFPEMTFKEQDYIVDRLTEALNTF